MGNFTLCVSYYHQKKKANQTSHTRGTRVRPHEDMLGTRSPRGAGPPGTPS